VEDVEVELWRVEVGVDSGGGEVELERLCETTGLDSPRPPLMPTDASELMQVASSTGVGLALGL
jgi:hypothetical protein